MSSNSSKVQNRVLDRAPRCEASVSVIIGFKDWGLERLELSIQSIQQSLQEIDHEVIIADYGSENYSEIASLAQELGVVHERVETQGGWSRSRALNAGVRASTGRVLLAIDADMLFTPSALPSVMTQLEKNPQEIVILQCRDLPTGYSHEKVRKDGFDWDKFQRIASVRPRWGMGGLVAVHRDIWETLRGWDERMHTYGGEDIDFGKRAMKLGCRISWLDEIGVAMYHIWHPSTSVKASRSSEATAAIEHNRKIHSTDETFARNRVEPMYLPGSIRPQVTVLIDLRNACSDYARSSIASVLLQTLNGVEIIQIVPDPATDGMSSLPRVRSFLEALRIARGTFITNIDPGTLWLEDRLERLVGSWKPGVGVLSDNAAEDVYDAEEPVVLGRPVDQSHMLPTSMLVLRRLIVDDEVSPANGWGDLATSACTSGTKWAITSTTGQIFRTDISNEEESRAHIQLTVRGLQSCLNLAGLRVDTDVLTEPLPANSGTSFDALRHQRTFEFIERTAGNHEVSSIHTERGDDTSQVLTLQDGNGHPVLSVTRVTTNDPIRFAEFTINGLEFGGDPVLINGADSQFGSRAEAITECVKYFENVHGDGSESCWLLAFENNSSDEPLHASKIEEILRSSVGPTVVLRRVLLYKDASSTVVAARFSAASKVEAAKYANRSVRGMDCYVVEIKDQGRIR